MRGKKTPTLQWNHTYFDLTNIVICDILRKNKRKEKIMLTFTLEMNYRADSMHMYVYGKALPCSSSE